MRSESYFECEACGEFIRPGYEYYESDEDLKICELCHEEEG